ncbi:MAG: SDR family oxidoreductase [Pseudomonadota bacterium]
MNILITAANSGFGALIVSDLIKAGHTVAGSVRDPQGRNAEAAAQLRDMGAHVVEIDVTDEASVLSGVAAAEAALGQIDVLINNAGVGAHGIQENFNTDDFQRLFDINLFGVQRMIRATAPAMRTRGNGLILNVSSLLGRVVMPFYGPYNASKWALEAMTENYRIELSGFGVDVAIVEPGGFPTTFFDNLIHPSLPDRNESYGPMAEAPDAALQGFDDFLKANPQQNPQLVSDAVLSVVNTPAGSRRFRTTVDTIGMGALVDPMNGQLSDAIRALFTNMGIDGMLTLNTASR